MPKTEYLGISFDSELEVDYYKYLSSDNNCYFMYQNQYKNNPLKINVGRRKTYTPDFVLWDDDSVTIIELKGWSKWSGNEDNNIMDFMKSKVAYDVGFLVSWLAGIGVDTRGKDIKYRRLKYLKAYGFVDYEWKNPNTIASKRKEKIDLLESELKDLKNYQKDCERFFGYMKKLTNNEKLTKSQLEWYYKFKVERGII